MTKPKPSDCFVVQYPDGYRVSTYRSDGSIDQLPAKFFTIESAQAWMHSVGLRKQLGSDIYTYPEAKEAIHHNAEEAVVPREVTARSDYKIKATPHGMGCTTYQIVPQERDFRFQVHFKTLGIRQVALFQSVGAADVFAKALTNLGISTNIEVKELS